MISLLLDTSNQALSVAVNRNVKCLQKSIQIIRRLTLKHSDNIQKVLSIANIKKSDIDRIIVAKVQGHIQVRIGITVAKMLAKTA